MVKTNAIKTDSTKADKIEVDVTQVDTFKVDMCNQDSLYNRRTTALATLGRLNYGTHYHISYPR